MLRNEIVYVAYHLYLYLESASTYPISFKKIRQDKIDTVYTKWGNLDEKLLNRVIAIKIIELGGKN
jgi:hypothetical protein